MTPINWLGQKLNREQKQRKNTNQCTFALPCCLFLCLLVGVLRMGESGRLRVRHGESCTQPNTTGTTFHFFCWASTRQDWARKTKLVWPFVIIQSTEWVGVCGCFTDTSFLRIVYPNRRDYSANSWINQKHASISVHVSLLKVGIRFISWLPSFIVVTHRQHRWVCRSFPPSPFIPVHRHRRHD